MRRYVKRCSVTRMQLARMPPRQKRLSRGAAMQKPRQLSSMRLQAMAQAQSVVDDLAKRFPQDTIVQSFWLPTVRSQIATSRKNAAQSPSGRTCALGVSCLDL